MKTVIFIKNVPPKNRNVTRLVQWKHLKPEISSLDPVINLSFKCS